MTLFLSFSCFVLCLCVCTIFDGFLSTHWPSLANHSTHNVRHVRLFCMTCPQLLSFWFIGSLCWHFVSDGIARVCEGGYRESDSGVKRREEVRREGCRLIIRFFRTSDKELNTSEERVLFFFGCICCCMFFASFYARPLINIMDGSEWHNARSCTIWKGNGAWEGERERGRKRGREKEREKESSIAPAVTDDKKSWAIYLVFSLFRCLSVSTPLNDSGVFVLCISLFYVFFIHFHKWRLCTCVERNRRIWWRSMSK